MSNEVYSCDNAGNRVGVGAVSVDPVAATGITLTATSAGTDYTQTVVGGKRYVVTSQKTGGFAFGIAVVTTAANIIWACPLYGTIIIKVPEGITTLHYTPDTNAAVGYLREVT